MKKLRRKGISSHEVSDVYLEREYLPEHNGRFARAAAKPEDYHRRGRGPRHWTAFSGWRASAPLVGTGWCATTIGFSNSSRRIATTRQHGARCWCAKGGTGASPSSIAGASLRWRWRSPRRPSRVCWSNGPPRRMRHRPSGSGCRQPNHPWRKAACRATERPTGRAPSGAAVAVP